MEDVKINEMMARFITCACNKDSDLMKKVLDQQNKDGTFPVEFKIGNVELDFKEFVARINDGIKAEKLLFAEQKYNETISKLKEANKTIPMDQSGKLIDLATLITYTGGCSKIVVYLEDSDYKVLWEGIADTISFPDVPYGNYIVTHVTVLEDEDILNITVKPQDKHLSMNIEDLIVSAESVETGERLIGYVCGCTGCKTAFENEEYDHSRPIGLLTHPNEEYGNVRVYTDTMRFVNKA